MNDNALLIRALRMNAVFSTASVLFLVVGGRWIAQQLGLPGPLAVYVTAGLLAVFSLNLFQIVRTRTIREWEIRAVIAGDVAWVVASAVLLVIHFEQVTAAGLMLVDVVAVAVAFFAVQQYRGLKAWRALG